MTLVLDPPLKAGSRRVAVLSETHVTAHGSGRGLWATAIKTPVAVLVADADSLHAMDLRGRPLDTDTLEAACPGLVARMQAIP